MIVLDVMANFVPCANANANANANATAGVDDFELTEEVVMATRTECEIHIRVSRRLKDSLQTLAEEAEMTLAEFLRHELSELVRERRRSASSGGASSHAPR